MRTLFFIFNIFFLSLDLVPSEGSKFVSEEDQLRLMYNQYVNEDNSSEVAILNFCNQVVTNSGLQNCLKRENFHSIELKKLYVNYQIEKYARYYRTNILINPEKMQTTFGYVDYKVEEEKTNFFTKFQFTNQEDSQDVYTLFFPHRHNFWDIEKYFFDLNNIRIIVLKNYYAFEERTTLNRIIVQYCVTNKIPFSAIEFWENSDEKGELCLSELLDNDFDIEQVLSLDLDQYLTQNFFIKIAECNQDLTDFLNSLLDKYREQNPETGFFEKYIRTFALNSYELIKAFDKAIEQNNEWYFSWLLENMDIAKGHISKKYRIMKLSFLDKIFLKLFEKNNISFFQQLMKQASHYSSGLLLKIINSDSADWQEILNEIVKKYIKNRNDDSKGFFFVDLFYVLMNTPKSKKNIIYNVLKNEAPQDRLNILKIVSLYFYRYCGKVDLNKMDKGCYRFSLQEGYDFVIDIIEHNNDIQNELATIILMEIFKYKTENEGERFYRKYDDDVYKGYRLNNKIYFDFLGYCIKNKINIINTDIPYIKFFLDKKYIQWKNSNKYIKTGSVLLPLLAVILGIYSQDVAEERLRLSLLAGYAALILNSALTFIDYDISITKNLPLDLYLLFAYIVSVKFILLKWLPDHYLKYTETEEGSKLTGFNLVEFLSTRQKKIQ